MSLKAVLVDQARVVVKKKGPKIEGTSQMQEADTPYFRARLFLENAPERREQGERRKPVATPTVMYATFTGTATLVELHAKDELDIVSAELGSARWRVTDEPAPIRKKRRVIGFEASLERVVEPNVPDA